MGVPQPGTGTRDGIYRAAKDARNRLLARPPKGKPIYLNAPLFIEKINISIKSAYAKNA
jgi:hypothetical protein